MCAAEGPDLWLARHAQPDAEASIKIVDGEAVLVGDESWTTMSNTPVISLGPVND